MANSRFANINSYIKYIRENFSTVGKTNNLLGSLFVYNYKFNMNPDFYNKDYDEIKFYDWMPATYIFNIRPESKTFFGLNLHHLPLKARDYWLTRFSGINTQGKDRFYLPYDVLKVMHIKSKFGIRQYRMDRTFNIRLVPFSYWGELFDFYAKTYFGVTIKDVQMRYREYNPYKK